MTEEDNKELNEYLLHLKDIIHKSVLRLEERWNSWEIDANKLEIHEVTGAIVARQITLAKSFSDNPQLWNNDLAPLFLRAMTENYITLNWILQDPLDRSRKFIAYGIGNEKLQIEKRTAALEEAGEDAGKDESIKHKRQWVDFHRYTFLTTVDIGSWSGISTRQMAIDSGCKDFYDLVYDPFSNCTHSSWNHIGKFNVKMSENPLHKFIRLPYVSSGEISGFYADLSIKYLSMIFDSFESKFFAEIEDLSILEIYQTELE